MLGDARPAPTALDGCAPADQQVLALRVVHARLETTVELPHAGELVERGPHAGAESRQERGAQHRGLRDAWPDDRDAQHVRLEAAQQIVRGRTAVDPQLGELDARIRSHRSDHVGGLVGHRLQRGPGEVATVGPARQPDEQAAGVRVPVRRPQSRECRDEVDALVAGWELRGEGLALGRVIDDAELVAHPLHARAGHEDRALEHIRVTPVESPADGGEQSCA